MLPITRSNLQFFCRLCLQELLVKDISSTEPNHDLSQSQLFKVVQSISGITMENSEQSELYPQSICHGCYVKANAFLSFRDKAIISTGVLKILVVEDLQKAALRKLKNFCRVCRREQNQQSAEIFTTEKHGEVFNCIYECTGLILAPAENSNDPLKEDSRFPAHICNYCHTTLKNFMEFRAMSRETDKCLRELLSSGQEVHAVEKGFAKEAGVLDDQGTTEIMKQEKLVQLPFGCNRENGIDIGCEYELPIKVEMEVSDSEIQVDMDNKSHENNSNNKGTERNLKELGSTNSCANTDPIPESEKFNEIYNHDIFNGNLDDNSEPTTNDDNIDPNEYYVNMLALELSQKRKFENVFKCTQCNKRFYKKYLFDAHVKAAHEGVERPFACPHCPSTFRIVLLLSRHIRAKHIGTQKVLHDCMFCQKQYSRKDHLKEHIRAIHEGLCPFKCSICGMEFSSKKTQIRHEQSHTETRPYACEHCNKRYKTEHELTIHLQKFHTTNPDLVCSICKRSKPTEEALQKHMEMHKASRQHQCAKCGKVFTKLFHLQEHEITVHLKLRPFKCCHCGLAFGARKSLKLHERNHDPTGRTEQCSICQLYFQTKRALLMHMSKTHPTERET